MATDPDYEGLVVTVPISGPTSYQRRVMKSYLASMQPGATDDKPIYKHMKEATNVFLELSEKHCVSIMDSDDRVIKCMVRMICKKSIAIDAILLEEEEVGSDPDNLEENYITFKAMKKLVRDTIAALRMHLEYSDDVKNCWKFIVDELAPLL